MNLNQQFWEEKYNTGATGWDIGYVSTPIKTYIDQLEHKQMKILIPGAGNSYEAEYLYSHGFENIHIIDISTHAVENFTKRVPNFPKNHIHCQDFFEHTGDYDLILEQTFFCALDPALRDRYIQKIHSLLKPKGKLVGVLFGVPMREDHPPFGGSAQLYETLFSPYFSITIMETAYNSIPPRQGNELFIILEKKETS